jgi:hypothetical protein
MKVNIRLPKTRLLCCCLLLFSLFFIHQSCTKIDTAVPSGNAPADAEVTQRFFNVPANAPAAAKRLANELKRRNNSSEFVKNFVKNNGYPAWDKVLLPVEHPVAHASFSVSASSEDTVIIVPVVPQGQEIVSSFIKAFINDNINISLYRGSDYAAYSFNSVPADSISADKAAIQIMILNNYVFGYKDFNINDERLFQGIAPNPNHRRRIATVAPQGSPGLLGEMLCTRVCVSILCSYCGQMSCPLTITTCLTSCETIGPSNPGGDPTTGGGGGGGGSTTPPGGFPCASSQGKGIAVANPCGGGPTIPPVEPIVPVKSPCEAGQNLINIPGVIGKNEQLKGYIPGNREMAYTYNESGGSILSIGRLYRHSVDIKIIENCINYTHIHNLGSTYYMFSWGDVDKMLEVFTGGSMAENATVGLIAMDSTPYILTIQNQAAFATAISNFKNEYELDADREKAYLKYFSGSTKEEKVLGFLKYMTDIGAPISLLRADGCCDLVEIKINAAGTALIETPCN